MARLPFVERDQAPPEVQAAYDKVLKTMGRVSSFVKLIADHSPSLPSFLEWYPKLRNGALDIKLRQLAYVKASQVNGCHY